MTIKIRHRNYEYQYLDDVKSVTKVHKLPESSVISGLGFLVTPLFLRGFC